MSTPDQYLPRADSLPHRVCSYFARLPDEELSNKDIALKWQCDPKNILMQLKQAVDAGLLVRDGMVYSAGPHIGRMSDAPVISSPFVGLTKSGDPLHPLMLAYSTPLVLWSNADGGTS